MKNRAEHLLITLRRTVLVLGLAAPALFAAQDAKFEESARAGHAVLTRLCDDFGGRVAGSMANEGAMRQLDHELRQLGYKPEWDRFKMPGWERGRDSVHLTAPLDRALRVTALAYTQPQPAFTADVVDIGGLAPENLSPSLKGRVGLLSAGTLLQTREVARIAHEQGLRAILFINREDGGQLLARTGSFVGEALPVPVFSVTQEEGKWLQRLLARGREVRVRIETTSRCREIETANLVLRLPGRSAERVIVGAHFDSWDLGQGALDNGLGIAQLYAIAHALRGAELERTVELVWYNAEEIGLWGSRHAAASVGDGPVIAMVNLDMVGVPIAVNALGDESLVPALERWHASRPAPLPLGVQNINWFGSDHTPYQLAGVRAVTFNAPIPREYVRYYHDMADTIDKLPEKIVVDSTRTIGDVVLALVNDAALRPMRRTPEQSRELFTTFGLERRMRAIGYWPFDDVVEPAVKN